MDVFKSGQTLSRLEFETMAALIAGLTSCGTYSAGMIGSCGIVVGTYIYQGMAIVGTIVWSFGSWACSGVTFLFSCCTGCGHKGFSEILRPMEEWDESRRSADALLFLVCFSVSAHCRSHHTHHVCNDICVVSIIVVSCGPEARERFH